MEEEGHEQERREASKREYSSVRRKERLQKECCSGRDTSKKGKESQSVIGREDEK